jgi:hypothetical protein
VIQATDARRFKKALGIMRESTSGDGPARQGAGLLSPSCASREEANIQCSKELGGSNPPPHAHVLRFEATMCDYHDTV